MPSLKKDTYPSLPRYEDTVQGAPNINTPLLPNSARTPRSDRRDIETGITGHPDPCDTFTRTCFMIINFVSFSIVYLIPINIYFSQVPGYFIFMILPWALLGRFSQFYFVSGAQRDLAFHLKASTAFQNALLDFFNVIGWIVVFMILRFAMYCVLAVGWEIGPSVLEVVKTMGEGLWEVFMALWKAVGEPVWNAFTHPGDLFEKLLHWGIWKF